MGLVLAHHAVPQPPPAVLLLLPHDVRDALSLLAPIEVRIPCPLSTLPSHQGGRQALAVMRVVISAIFVHMAAELAPPHTHRRLLNLAHVVVFALGVGVSATAELIERMAVE